MVENTNKIPVMGRRFSLSRMELSLDNMIPPKAINSTLWEECFSSSHGFPVPSHQTTNCKTLMVKLSRDF